eukprot:scaffold260212_cov19-Prasinocladus_malaysianus.AAC.1
MNYDLPSRKRNSSMLLFVFFFGTFLAKDKRGSYYFGRQESNHFLWVLRAKGSGCPIPIIIAPPHAQGKRVVFCSASCVMDCRSIRSAAYST